MRNDEPDKTDNAKTADSKSCAERCKGKKNNSELFFIYSQTLSLFLSQTPVYRLDGSRQNEARIKEKVEALKVEPGRLVIPFKLL